ncbi:MAG: gamma-glutamyl-gamma-aminobutyrate hydrolase family protein [Trueperaceae bacterium]|nr:gamma-glutamyl-gamma-aminobutyrate hydrolase family protein [Trueperaceae bacterium]
MPSSPRPLVLISTSTNVLNLGLRRVDMYSGKNYADAVLAEGGLPAYVTNHAPAAAADFVARADGLVLSGGPDVDPYRYGQVPHPDLGAVDPERDAFELALYQAARDRGKPVFGVCRGVQVINVAEGGTLHQHLPALGGPLQHSQRDPGGRPHHQVALTEGSAIHAAFGAGEALVNTYHHQGLDRLGAGLRATAHAEDGLVEAVEGTSGAWLLGVQWHPEMSYHLGAEHHAPFHAFLEACRAALAQG